MSLDERIILKFILDNGGVTLWTGLKWIGIRSSGGSFENGNEQ
jgi:hypothetical protein